MPLLFSPALAHLILWNCIRSTRVGPEFSPQLNLLWLLTKPDFFVLLPNLISSKISIYIVWMFQLLALLWKCLLSTLMVTFISPRIEVGFCLKIQKLRQKMSIFNRRREGMNNDSKCKFFFYFVSQCFVFRH